MDQAFVRVCDDCFRVGDWAGGYVIRVGGVGVCIDAPGGAWIERLDEIGVSRVEWVLATHHHRDTLASAGALVAGGARLIAPSAERGLVADVEQFWQTARTYVLYNCGSEFFSLRQNVPVEPTRRRLIGRPRRWTSWARISHALSKPSSPTACRDRTTRRAASPIICIFSA